MKKRVPNWLITEVTKREGKKQSISRAQVAEVLRHTFDIISESEFKVPAKVMIGGHVLCATLMKK